MLDTDEIIAAYNRSAADLCAQYESEPFEALHSEVLDLLPGKAGSDLEVVTGDPRKKPGDF